MSCNNTNSTCTSCNHNYSSCDNKCAKCGCKDSFLTSPPPCPTPQGCPDPIPCQEVLASDCIIYTGPDVLCNGDIVVYNDATWTEVLEDIVAYFCVPPIPEILCGEDIVVIEESSINEALEDIVNYICDNLTTANNGLTMSPTSNNVQLGGTLIQNTTLTNSTFNLNINSTTVPALTLFKSTINNAPTLLINDPAVSTTAPAIQAYSNRYNISNPAVYFENLSSNIDGGLTLLIKSQNNTINTISPQITTPTLYIQSSKTASTTTQVALRVDNTNNINAGSGIAIEFANSDATPGTGIITNRLISKTVNNSTETSMTSEFVIQGKPGGTVNPVDHLTLKSTGQLQLNNYGSGLFAGVPTYTLSTTASGDIIETIPGLGPAGPTGPAGTNGTNGTNAFKYIHELNSVFDSQVFTILRTDLEACGIIPEGCFDPRLVSEVCDLHVRLYYLLGGVWRSIPEKLFGLGQGYILQINDTTGDIVITLDISPISPAVRVRVVILA
jgi:hypothetical protein